MAWRAYYDNTTGRLVSITSVWDTQTPPGLAFTEFPDPMVDLAALVWNEATRLFEPRPAKVLIDRLQDIISDPACTDNLIALWQNLNAANRTRLRNGLILLLGRARYRAQTEPVTIEQEG